MCKTALIILGLGLTVTVLGCGGTSETGDLGVAASDQSLSGTEDMASSPPDLSASNPDDLALAPHDMEPPPLADLATSPADLKNAGDLAMAAQDLAMAAQDLAGTVTQPLPSTTGDGTFTISGRSESAIRVVVPSPKPAQPPLVIAFHATGGEPSHAISDSQLSVNAAKYGLVAIAPRAGYRSGSHPGDVDHEPNSGGSSWNMWDPDPNTNDDLRYVQALIAAAKTTWDVDTTRVYTVGFSNGAFFAYFAAASLPTQIAGFAETSGGWTTDACPTRYGGSSAESFFPKSGPAPGVAISCSTLYASTNPQFPSACIPSASNPLRPPTPGTRVPFGYLAHYTSDEIVSVAWSCYLATALGTRAQTSIRYSDTDGTFNHTPQPDFFDGAWTFFAGRTNGQ